MLIEVIRCDNRCDSVEDFMLDGLIESKDILKFKRGEEWVTLGKDPIRKRNRKKESKDNDKKVANDDTFTREYRHVSSSSLEPF